MDTYLASIVLLGAASIALTIWTMRWLKVNYPQSYDDPAMASLGGFAAFSVLVAQKLSISEPYNLLIVAIPIFIVISFMSAGKLNRRLGYASLSTVVVLLSAAGPYWGRLNSWVAYTAVSVMFIVLWVILFRWRYVHCQNN